MPFKYDEFVFVLIIGTSFVRCNDSENLFHCDQNSCIPKQNVCNGIRECVNGADEHVRECGNVYHMNYE